MSKKFFVPLLALTLILSLGFTAFADTIRLKDGSVIRGQVVGFKDQQFTVLIGGGSRGRRSTVLLYMEDVESIEFDAATATTTSISSNDDDGNTMTDVTTPQSTQSSTQLPRPTASRPNSTQPSSGTQSSNNRPGSTGTTTRPPATTTRPSTSATAPNYVPINARVPGDNASEGWTNSGLVVRRGQRLRITATGQVSLGNGRSSTPSGIATLQDKDKLMPNEPTGALVAVIGVDNNDFIFIGRVREFIAQREGMLFLGVNVGGNPDNNTGAYEVIIEADASGGSR